MKLPILKSFRLKNFKAVRDSGRIKFTPLTVLIGNNGSGKSSIVEGLEALQAIVVDGLDKAMQQWRGFEHIQHQGVQRSLVSPKDGRQHFSHPIGFEMQCNLSGFLYSSLTEINIGPGGNELFISKETAICKGHWEFVRDALGNQKKVPIDPSMPPSSPDTGKKLFRLRYRDGESMLTELFDFFIPKWQFLTLIPQNMGYPLAQQRTGGPIRLNKDGSNIAEYLLSLRKIDPIAFEGVIETLKYVLPYAKDIQPNLTSELERTVYLQLAEGHFKVPGWLLSTGTLRILSLLALLRHPTPPPLIVIEEIENGLDPRTTHLIVEEIRQVVEAGKTQVIATTHSPYLLDLLHLSHVILVERIDGQPIFTRPADQESLQEWSKKYGPGKLYTMDLLHHREGK